MNIPPTSSQAPEGSLLAEALTVSEITSRVKGVLEEALPMCWVSGEVMDFSRASSGHCYLTLKDESSQLPCVMFRFYAGELSFAPEPGMMVVAYGNISVYERGGRYQFLAYQMQPAGVGDLARAFERLRSRLEEEGLFDEERKRVLPSFPHAVGIVTSPTGAALRDIAEVVGRRAPGIQLVLRPARVQGYGAAEEIARAIADLNRLGGLDILIVGRGGGSPEDLEFRPIMEPNGYCYPCKKKIRGSSKRRMQHGLRHLADGLQADFDRRREE